VRLRSIDVFRGLTVAGMVIVNNPGDWNVVYAPLLHAEWHGWTPTDLIFPFFLFIVGVAITLARRATSAAGTVWRRGLTIFGLGLFLSGFPFYNLATWRIPGVLQRIAICYVAAVFISRAVAGRNDMVQARRLLAVVVAIVVAYAVAMSYLPFPGGEPGNLTAAGNLGAWIDRTLMPGHLWRPEWDPEGVFSTIPAVATTLLGVIAGLDLRVGTRERWVRHLLLGGVGAAVLGLLWDPWFPINKSLWTSSYVLFTGGLAAMALALCSLWTDGDDAAWRRRTSEPFVALGRNAILLFVLSGLIGRLLGVIRVGDVSLKSWIYTTSFLPVASPKNASLLFAAANLAGLFALLWWLHRRHRYWSV
jgi:predicted acyltransferase